jgi:LPS-assembly lipoprotein
MPTMRGGISIYRIGVIFLVGVLALGLGACGFEPLYAKRETSTDVALELAKVKVGTLTDPAPGTMKGIRDFPIENDRSRQILRNYLQDDLGPRNGAVRGEYVLNIQILEPRTNVAIDRSDSTLRYGYSVVTYFDLRDNAGKQLFSGSSSSATTFAVSQSEFATISSQKDARDRAMQEISQDIRNQLAVYFYGKGK